MKIRNIILKKQKKKVMLSALIAFQGEKFQEMFFVLDSKYQKFITNDATPFLAALLAPCMKKGENIDIDGNISAAIAGNIHKIMNALASFKVGFKKIKVNFKGTVLKESKGKFCSLFFTGGVDSFYTYLKHKKSISHFIFIHGCDIPIKDEFFFRQVKKSIDEIGQIEKKKIIIVKTNYREIIEPQLEWEWNLGGALASIALLLRKGIKKAYIAGGMRKNQLVPYGTHPDYDPLWSTETLSIIHSGCRYSRLEKVLFTVSKSPLALSHLRVCCFVMKDKYNCNECFKCLQTKMELFCANALDKTKTFDHNINPLSVRKIYYDTNLNFHIFGKDVLHYLKTRKINPKLQQALSQSLQKSRHPSLLKQIINWMAYLDKTYNKRRLYSRIFDINKNHDRKLIFKIMANLGVIR